MGNERATVLAIWWTHRYEGPAAFEFIERLRRTFVRPGKSSILRSPVGRGMSDAYVVTPGQGQTFDLGIIQMRLLAPKELTWGQFALTEFRGGEGPWTIPHIHRHTVESFFVLDGTFLFTVGGRDIEVGPGAYLLVPPGTPHAIQAREGGGRFLTLMAPARLEGMFIELSRLPPDSLRDPQVRREVSARFDSHPI